MIAEDKHWLRGGVACLCLLGYLYVIAFFALRPFHRIPGLSKGSPSAGLEDPQGAITLRKALKASGHMSLAALIHPNASNNEYNTCMISLSRDALNRNFTLGQVQKSVTFRLRTTETDPNGMNSRLVIPDVFEAEEPRHVVVTYDGTWVRMFVDGKVRSPELALSGSFANWGRNHLLTVGDEPVGGAEWRGEVEHFSVYDRALGAREVKALAAGSGVAGAVYVYPGMNGPLGGMRRLRYRNLFIHGDPVFQMEDCVANIIGFMPLAFLIYFTLPRAIRLRMPLALLFPVMAGFIISGMIEWTQRMLIGRVPTFLDLVYNVLGALLGSLLLWMVLVVKQRLCSRNQKE